MAYSSKRVSERLRGEYGYIGGLTIVKDYVPSQRQREVFVPLQHDPGHTQADSGEALAAIGGGGTEDQLDYLLWVNVHLRHSPYRIINDRQIDRRG